MNRDMNYYIGRQAVALENTLQSRKTLGENFCSQWKAVCPDRLYLVGSGTSGNAVRVAAPFMQEVLGVETMAVSPTSLPRVFTQKPLFVFVSQGGYSTNTLHAMKMMRKWPAVTLTGDEKCRVNEMCDKKVVLCCEHEEAGPKTMGYTCTVLTLYLMALEAAREYGTLTQSEYDSYIEALSRMIHALPRNIETVYTWYAGVEDRLANAQNYIFVGTTVGQYVADESALKLQETVLRPSMGFEYEEFLHGPTSMFDVRPAGFYFLPSESNPDRARLEALAKIHSEWGGFSITMSCGPKGSVSEEAIVVENTDEEWLYPFWQILPGQVIGANLPEKLGLSGRGRELFSEIDNAVGVKYGGIV